MMLRTLPPTNWSQISKEIPSSLVIISYKKWDGGEDGMGEKGGGSQRWPRKLSVSSCARTMISKFVQGLSESCSC